MLISRHIFFVLPAVLFISWGRLESGCPVDLFESGSIRTLLRVKRENERRPSAPSLFSLFFHPLPPFTLLETSLPLRPTALGLVFAVFLCSSCSPLLHLFIIDSSAARHFAPVVSTFSTNRPVHGRIPNNPLVSPRRWSPRVPK